ncbi:UNVERIFIED_CONTAM: hypothetical protein PYX00_010559 [Menopon gallinae]|uniref:Uncharacterized protein n=1 Tax=Menopon gallinae TaxID=328185 RepID=A0AAW2HGU8_9NEOP
MSRLTLISLVALVATSHFCTVSGLSCYHCQVPRPKEGEEQDLTCLNNPESIKNALKTCPPSQRACRTKRIDQSGKIYSLERGCSSLREDSTEEKLPFVINDRYCTTNRCNKGNGLDSDKTGLQKRITAILIKDVDSGGRYNNPTLLFLIVSVSASILFSL